MRLKWTTFSNDEANKPDRFALTPALINVQTSSMEKNIYNINICTKLVSLIIIFYEMSVCV